MIFVTSDLHGCSLADFKALLKKAKFCDSDFCFVLGDVIDRGEHGVELLRWMCEQSNIQLILGNHESLLLSSEFIFEEISDESLTSLDSDKLDILNTWIANGASPTLSQLRKMLKEEPDVLEGILDFLKDAPLYDIVEVNGVEYILVHSGIENFQADKTLEDYSPNELLWARPTIDTKYYSDGKIVIFGHTPTKYFGEEYAGKMVSTDSWICIDTGAASGNKPMLLCLDNMKEFYLSTSILDKYDII